MKHLKSYENTTEDDISKLKKYLVYNDNSTYYYIDTIKYYDKISNDITCKMIYQYYDKILNFKSINSIHTYSPISEYLKDILFTSDNLEECFEFIKQLFILKKYNL
jgi:hypothetical protein